MMGEDRRDVGLLAVTSADRLNAGWTAAQRARERGLVGAQGAADLLRRHGTLEALLKTGRFATQAKDLRLYRAIATMDRKAPLPRLPDQTPSWDSAAALARTLGLNQLADRLGALLGTKAGTQSR
jgi:hypothetical protein